MQRGAEGEGAEGEMVFSIDLQEAGARQEATETSHPGPTPGHTSFSTTSAVAASAQGWCGSTSCLYIKKCSILKIALIRHSPKIFLRPLGANVLAM